MLAVRQQGSRRASTQLYESSHKERTPSRTLILTNDLYTNGEPCAIDAAWYAQCRQSRQGGRDGEQVILVSRHAAFVLKLTQPTQECKAGGGGVSRRSGH